MKKLKLRSALTALAAVCVLSACNKTEPTSAEVTTALDVTTAATTAATTTAATTTAVTTTAASVTDTATSAGESVYPELNLQSYNDIEFVEVIEIGTDNETLSSAMIEANEDIYENVMKRIERYEELLEESDNNTNNYIGGINVWAYSITDENYIQIYNTVFEYPTYGTEGDLFGFVYDMKNDDYITLDEYMSANGTSEDELTEKITAFWSENYPDEIIGTIDIKTFNLMQGPDGEYLASYLFEMDTSTAEAEEPWKGFYTYTPYDGDVWEMNSDQLFDPYSLDEYDPPLHGNPGWDEYFGDDGQGDVISPDETFGILQGDYYIEGDTVSAHFSFYGNDTFDFYYADGSYEGSYTLSPLPDEEITDDSGDTYNEVTFEVFTQDGEFIYVIKMLDAAPGTFDLYDTDGNLVWQFINTSI
jgi:hypothetical protein